MAQGKQILIQTDLFGLPQVCGRVSNPFTGSNRAQQVFNQEKEQTRKTRDSFLRSCGCYLVKDNRTDYHVQIME